MHKLMVFLAFIPQQTAVPTSPFNFVKATPPGSFKFSYHTEKDGTTHYTIDTSKEWTCAPSSVYPPPPAALREWKATAVTITCLKREGEQDGGN